MNCPKEDCTETNFYELSHGSTMLGWGYTPSGHNHNPNHHTRTYMCKNGHKFDIHYKQLCPVENCEFNESFGM